MRNFRHQAHEALRVYLKRGEDILRLAENDRFDDLIETVTLRKAAFHNFRVAEALAVKNGDQIVNSPEFVEMIDKVDPLNEKVESSLVTIYRQLGNQLQKNQGNRARLSKYHSGKSAERTLSTPA